MKSKHPDVQRRVAKAVDLLTVAGLLGFVVAEAVVGVVCSGVWAGTQSLKQGFRERRNAIWVRTCPLTGESALVALANGAVQECTLGGRDCGLACAGKTSTVESGIFDTSKLLNLNHKASSANSGC